MNEENSKPESGDCLVPDTTGLSALEERQQLLAHHVRMVAKKLSHSLFVFGSQGGLGKTRTINQVFDEEGVDPVLINSHVTPLALYGILYQYKDDAVLFFDDVDSIFSSMVHLGLLRSALWGSPRIVTYGSSQMPKDLPPSFDFSSRCIFAANVIPSKNEAFKAVLSRCDIFELSATNEEVLDLMRCVASNGYRGITPNEASTIIDFIGENCQDREISMRLLGPSLRKYMYAREQAIDWRPMVESQLHTLGRKQLATRRLDTKSKDIKLLKLALDAHPNAVKDQQEFWCEKTNKSRASFYRILARYRDNQS